MTSPDPVIEHRSGPGQPWTRVTTKRAGGLTLNRILPLLGGGLLLLVPTIVVLRWPARDEENPAASG